MTTAPNFTLHWTGSSRFSSFSMGTALAAAPGQSALPWAADRRSSRDTAN